MRADDTVLWCAYAWDPYISEVEKPMKTNQMEI